MKLTACPDCGAPRPARGACRRCDYQPKTTSPSSAGRTRLEQRRRREAVAAHRARYGDWCPGWRRPPHASSDLTADHVHAVAAGGAQSGALSVLCRSCNGRKQART